MRPVCVHGKRPAQNSPYHVYVNTPPGFDDGIYLAPSAELNRLSVTKGNTIKHKKFRTMEEAELYYFSTRPDNFCPLPAKGESAVAYTDGSFSPKENKYSYGAYITYDGCEYEICGKLSCPDKKFRNIAGEVEAARQAISFCRAREIRSVEIRHDFVDIADWAKRGGKNELANAFHKFCEGVRKAGMNIRFTKVKAHSGNRFNERADRLSRVLWNGV